MELTIRFIIEKYLRDNGFEGLFSLDECACELSDLFPCDEGWSLDCQPGYKEPCDCGEDQDHGEYHIVKDKKAPKRENIV